MPIRSERTLLAGLSLYSVLILGSQATMSLGIPILLLGALFGFGGFRAFGLRIQEAYRLPVMKFYLRATSLLVGAFLLSLLGAEIFPLEIGGVKPEVKWVRDVWKAWYFFWPVAVVPCVRALSEDSRKTLLRVFLGAFGIVALIGCFQFFTGWPRPQPVPGHSFFHVTVFPGHHLSFASIAIFPFFLALSEVFETRWLGRKVALGISVLGLAAIFGTYSRQVWISLPIGLFAFAVTKLPRRAAISAVVVGVFVLVGLFQVPAVRERAESGMGIRDRVELWKANTELFKRRPVTGVGWHHNLQLSAGYFAEVQPENKSPFVGHAHSNFFEFLGGMGIIGVLAYLVWTFVTLRLSYAAGAGFFAAWVVFHLNGLTQVNFSESKVLHSMMWSITMAVTLIAIRTGRSTAGGSGR